MHLAIRDMLLTGRLWRNKRYYFVSHSTSDGLNREIATYRIPDKKKSKKDESENTDNAKKLENLPIMDFREETEYIELLRYYYRKEPSANYIHIENETAINENEIAKYKASISNAIRYAVYDALKQNLYNYANIKPSDKIIPMLGQKNELMNTNLASVFASIKEQFSFKNYYEPFVGTANVYLHNSLELDNTHIYLNDINKNIIRLLKACADQSDLIKLQYIIMHDLEYSETSFYNYVKELEYPTSNWTDLQRAGMLYLISYSSVMANMKDFNYNKNDNPYSSQGNLEERYQDEKLALLANAHMLYKFYDKLHGVNFSSIDFSIFLEKNYQNPDSLFYIDSPYWYTEDTCSKENTFTETEHAKVAEYAEKISLANNVFVISNRITLSQTMRKQKHKDQEIINTANAYYSGKGYHKLLILYDKQKKQVEIVISNVPFAGSTPFDKPLTEEEVASIYK